MLNNRAAIRAAAAAPHGRRHRATAARSIRHRSSTDGNARLVTVLAIQILEPVLLVAVSAVIGAADEISGDSPPPFEPE